MVQPYRTPPCPYPMNTPMQSQNRMQHPVTRDDRPEPFVVNISQAARQNDAFRRVLWTGQHLQLTLMSLYPGEDIGLEMHPHLDQFLRIEQGQGLVKMGGSSDALSLQQRVFNGFAFIIPAGTWHNLVNTGNQMLKLYSIYAPPQHPAGTLHMTRSAAHAAE